MIDAAASGSGKPRLPQNIGHRGYKAAFPENTMAAFHGAVVAGAPGLETDLHLSRDGVVVLSHVSKPDTPNGSFCLPARMHIHGNECRAGVTNNG